MYTKDDFNDVIDALGDEMVCGQEYPLRPIVLPTAQQSSPEESVDQHNHASCEISAQTPCMTDAAAVQSCAPPTDAYGFDFTRTDNPQTPPDDVRELPIWALPNYLQKVVENVAQGYQCNRDFVVASMFVAAATMLGKRVSCQFANHTNFPCLWVAIVGNTASGKTAPLSFFFKPIESMEKEAFEQYRKDFRQWEKQDASTREAKPEYRHNLINNPSDESVLHELSVNGSVCWKVDELRTMFDSFGKYSKSGGSGIVGNLLSIFNNVDINITRATNEPKYLSEPNLNIIGGTQPSILKRVMANKGFIDDGLFQRFLFVYPDPTHIPQFADVRISNDVRCIWINTIEKLATFSSKIHETYDATQMHISTINRWRDMCNNQYKDIDAMISLVKKLEIHLCRWSIVAAALLGSDTITADVMRYSVECMDYFRLCGTKTFCLIENGVEPLEPSRSDVFKLLQKWYGKEESINQSALAKALHVSQQAISKFLK